jgi:hypothetical protein
MAVDEPESGEGALPAPSAGELDVLGVFWEEEQGEGRRLQLAEVYRRVCERRRRFGEAEPALSTVSTHLRKLLGKGLLEESSAPRSAGPARPIRLRGGYTPPTRSPLTSYRARHGPGEVLRTTFRGLAAAYPPCQRLNALLDFARALDLPAAVLVKLEGVVASPEAAGIPAEEEQKGRV